MNLTEERELLLSYRPWLRTVAAGFPETHPSRVEDLAQEGWVAIWRAISKDKGGRPAAPFLKQCAINRMRDVFSEWTAQRRNVYSTHVVDMYLNSADVWAMLSTDLGEAEWAYHHGEIMAVINRLPAAQKQYVIRRFWHGWTPKTLGIYFDSPYRTWQVAKENLAKELAHLGAE